MSTTFKIKDHVTMDTISKVKPDQSRHLLTYLFNTYGHEGVDQRDLMLDLNTHQLDGQVLPNGSTGPISRAYEFYRKNAKCGWFEAGLIEIMRSSKALDAKAELENLKARVEYLEMMLTENNIEFDLENQE